MNIQLQCNELMTRVRLETGFRTTAATLVKAGNACVPALLADDPGTGPAAAVLAEQHVRHPDRCVACGKVPQRVSARAQPPG